MKKITAILMALCMLMTACGATSDTGGNKQITTIANKEATAEAAETELKSNLPDDLNLEGMTITILTAGDPMFVDAVAEISGDVVNDSIYARNSNIKEQLNVNFVYVPQDYDIAPVIRAAVLGGVDDYQLISGSQWIIAPVVLENAFMNLLDNKYLELDNPWWAVEYNKEAAVGNNMRFFISGDITLSMLKNMSCIYYNKTFYENMFGDADEMYTTVMDGKWTLDKLGEIGTQCYSDLNGDGNADDSDQYGYGVITANLTDHITYDAGIRVTQRRADGIPELIINNEKTIAYTEKLYNLFYENAGSRIFPATDDSNNITIPNKFKNNEIMFDLGWFSTSEILRDMEGDYGLIPYPKYNEAEEKYLSLVHDTSFVYCIPITIGNKFDNVCAVMEAMAFESYKDVTPTFYEIALKVKYVRDSDETALKIVDIIHAGATTDFAYIYNYALNNVGLIMRDLMGGKNSDFSSAYAKIQNAVLTQFDALIELYTSLD